MDLTTDLRKAQALMYTGQMTVEVLDTDAADEKTGISKHLRKTILEDIPCRISYQTIDQNEQADWAGIVQEVVLYCDPALTIPEGSRIAVVQNDVRSDYQISGKPAVFRSHQEIPLKIFKEYA